MHVASRCLLANNPTTYDSFHVNLFTARLLTLPVLMDVAKFYEKRRADIHPLV